LPRSVSVLLAGHTQPSLALFSQDSRHFSPMGTTLSKPAEDAASVGISFALRSALRPALTYTLQPYLKMQKPGGVTERLAPAVKFDVSQRSARAVFAMYFVFSALFTMASLKNKKNNLHTKEDEGPQENLVFSEQHGVCRRLVAQFFGFIAADTLDVLILNKKFGVFQGDIMVHHVVGLALFAYALLKQRAHTLLSYIAVAELLVPCGVALWWLKATNASNTSLKLVRVLGLIVLTMIRFPLFMWGARAMWLSRSQSLFPDDDERIERRESSSAPSDPNHEAEAQEKPTLLQKLKKQFIQPDSLMSHIVEGEYGKLSSKCLPETTVFSLSVLCALALDYRWTKLYWDGLFPK